MKFIDEKGRLFGKINLIDLLVILLVVAAVLAVIWKLGGNKAAEVIADNKYDAAYTVLVEDVPAEIAEYASSQIGASLVNNGKVMDAKIASVDAPESAVTPGHKDLSVTVLGTAVSSGNVYTIGPQEIRVGFEYILKTSEFELTGLISDLSLVKK